ncbi:MAG TPA: flagellar export chaperone FliS [Candidatus Competibacter sp.]|nr:flagellar export chaperone FliS [Candidatus Competibacter sp.]
MVTSNSSSALRQYRKIDTESATAYASPHRLIQMLMEGALDSLTKAKGHIQRGEVVAKGEQIGKAIGIVGGLREGLNLEVGELATNLDTLYDYMQRRLVETNRRSDPNLVEEVIDLLRPLKEAWDAIGDGAQNTEESSTVTDAPA